MVALAVMVFPLLLAVVLSALTLAQGETARVRVTTTRRAHFHHVTRYQTFGLDR